MMVVGKYYWWGEHIILTPRIRYSSYYCCSVTEKTDVMVLAYVMVYEEGRLTWWSTRRQI